jgi:hypothetical protein
MLTQGRRNVGTAPRNDPEIGKRLNAAFDYRNVGKLAAAREIQARGIVGGSYKSMSNYLGGHRVPSVAWIRAMAEILDVSERWLKTGEGTMVPEPAWVPNPPDKDEDTEEMDALLASLRKARLPEGMVSPIMTVSHLYHVEQAFRQRYGPTKGLLFSETVELYADHLLLPLQRILLHTRGTGELSDLGPEEVRQVLNQYLELVNKLMPDRKVSADPHRRAVVSRQLRDTRREMQRQERFPGQADDDQSAAELVNRPPSPEDLDGFLQDTFKRMAQTALRRYQLRETKEREAGQAFDEPEPSQTLGSDVWRDGLLGEDHFTDAAYALSTVSFEESSPSDEAEDRSNEADGRSLVERALDELRVAEESEGESDEES